MDQKLILRIEQLEKTNGKFKTFIVLLLLVVVSVFIYSFKQKASEEIIRTKGIVIVDESGRDRILIGAPIPPSKDRVRTDTALVRKYWASSLGADSNNYMEYYKSYRHATDGIVIMNSEGFDRVLLGDKLADPNTGQKMFESAGITWNDPMGWELGGAGVNTGSDGVSRAVLGLDDPKSNGEAIHLVALEDGTSALIIGSPLGRLVIGMNGKKSDFLQTTEAFTGLKYFNNQGELEWEQNILKK